MVETRQDTLHRSIVVLNSGLRFGSSPDPYLTKFCPVVEFPWYRMVKVSEERTWFFKIHVGIGWWSKVVHADALSETTV